MTRTLLIVSLILSGVVLANAQASQQRDEEKERRQAEEASFNRRVDGLRNVGKDNIIRDRYKNDRLIQEKVKPIYRKPTKEEQALLAPEAEDQQKYAGFLTQKGTGLTRLMVDRGCDKGIDIVVSTPHCLNYGMPGAGSSYSFRVDNYQRQRFSDLTYSNNRFYSKGLLVQGIFVDLGDVPLESLDLKSPGVKFLKDFKPSTDTQEVVDFNLQLEKGLKKDNFTYQLSAPLYENTTYVLRSIAYRGEVYRSVEDKVVYHEFEFDRRKDVIVAFRIVRYKSNHSITILWKRLAMKKSPKMDLKRNGE